MSHLLNPTTFPIWENFTPTQDSERPFFEQRSNWPKLTDETQFNSDSFPEVTKSVLTTRLSATKNNLYLNDSHWILTDQSPITCDSFPNDSDRDDQQSTCPRTHRTNTVFYWTFPTFYRHFTISWKVIIMFYATNWIRNYSASEILHFSGVRVVLLSDKSRGVCEISIFSA